MAKVKLLFICTANINRSRTAEDMLAGSDRYEVKSAGFIRLKDTGQVLTQELVDWADQIFVMNEMYDKHRTKLMTGFDTRGKDVFVLNVRDVYARGNKGLINLLKLRFAEFGIIWKEVPKMSNQQIIEKVTQWQNFEYVHPLTCGSNSLHGNLVPKEVDGKVILSCPECDYTQESIPRVVLSSYVERFKKFLRHPAD